MSTNEPLSIREHDRRDLVSRVFQVRAETIDESTRSVEAVIATESPVDVYDWRSGEVIQEVLLMDGVQMPSQMPLLANHDRWSLDSVLGSIRQMRVEGPRLPGRLYFATDDPAADSAWNKVKQRHLVDVSVGYRVNEAVEIPAGQTATVKGRQFTAGSRTLRIVTNWTPKEGSLVPIGADAGAKIRGEPTPIGKDATMTKQLRAFLETLGLKREATDAEAKTFYEGLKPEDKARADAAATAQNAPPPSAHGNRAEPPAADGQRAAPPATPPVPPTPPAAPQDAAAIARAAVADERNRIRELETLAGQDVPAAMLRQAVQEGWDLNRASREFLAGVRNTRSQAIGPAIHSHGREQDTSRRSLAASMLMEYGGLDRTRVVGAHFTNGRGAIDRAQRLTEQEVDSAIRLGAMSATDLIRLCAQMDTGRWHLDPEEAMRAAVSGGSLAYVFTTSIYAKILEGWSEVTDTTDWCDVEDVANFQLQEDISLAANAGLDPLGRGEKAKHATFSDSRETYKIGRFAKQFVVDEMDQIDDRLSAIMRMPMEFGRAAARLRPDLVYAILLDNPALSDGGDLFNATAVTTAGGHANLTTAALASAALKAGILAMGKYRQNGAVLNIAPRYLIVPSALKFTAMELLRSVEQAYTAAAAAATPSNYMTINILSAENIALRVDDRVGASGVTDPRTKTALTGLDTNWFLSAGGPRTMRVAYRRGTNRLPTIRSFVLEQGQWGIGFDVKHDIGAAPMDYRGMHKSTGAA